MVNPLSDGTPLSYDWLNSLVKDINDIKANQTAAGTKVTFFPAKANAKTKSTMQFIYGETTMNLTDGKGEATVSFKPAFANDSVSVFTQINFKSVSNFMGMVTVSQVDRNRCLIKVRQYGKTSNAIKSVKVDWLAMGISAS